MSEYSYVEQPFLARLHEMGWQVIDRGCGIPQDPAASLRPSFKEVILPQVLKDAVRAINKTADGREWLNDRQPDAVLREIDGATQAKNCTKRTKLSTSCF